MLIIYVLMMKKSMAMTTASKMKMNVMTVDRKDDYKYNEDDNNDDYVKYEDEAGCLEAEVDRKELLF